MKDNTFCLIAFKMLLSSCCFANLLKNFPPKFQEFKLIHLQNIQNPPNQVNSVTINKLHFVVLSTCILRTSY